MKRIAFLDMMMKKMAQPTKMVGTGLVIGGLIGTSLGAFFHSGFLATLELGYLIFNLFFILPVISFILFYLDNLKLSANDEIKYFQLFSFIGLLFVLIISIYNTINSMDFICYMGDKNKYVDLHGEYNMTKEAAENIGNGMNTVGKGINTVGQGLNTVGSNLGLTGAIVGTGTAVASGLAKAPMPPVQKAGVIIGGALAGGLIHSSISLFNRSMTKENIPTPTTNNTNFLSKDISSNISKFMDDSSLSPLQALIFNIDVLNAICISLIVILIIQIIYKLYLKDNIKLNLTSILGVKLNNTLEYYINKMITLNKKISIIYIWLIFIIVISALSCSIYISYGLYNNIDRFIAFHNYVIGNTNINKLNGGSSYLLVMLFNFCSVNCVC